MWYSVTLKSYKVLGMKLENEPRKPQLSPTRKALAVIPEKVGLSTVVDVKYLKPFENSVNLYHF